MVRNSLAKVLIKGDGIAALSAAQILSRNKISVAIQQEPFYPRPSLLIPEMTQWLIADIWGTPIMPKHIGRITYKKVYSADGSVYNLPFTGQSVNQNELQSKFKAFLTKNYPSIKWLSNDSSEDPLRYDHVINAIPMDNNCYQNWGSRCITAYDINLEKESLIGNSCHMLLSESLWIFLLLKDDEACSVQVMHLRDDVVPFEKIASIIKNKASIAINNSDIVKSRTFSAFPRILKPLFRANNIIIGQSLVRYDPIAGDGTGHALRSADWACKIILSARQGNDVNALLTHYYGSIEKHFGEHITTCIEHYTTYFGKDWQAETSRKNTFFKLFECLNPRLA